MERLDFRPLLLFIYFPQNALYTASHDLCSWFIQRWVSQSYHTHFESVEWKYKNK